MKYLFFRGIYNFLFSLILPILSVFPFFSLTWQIIKNDEKKKQETTKKGIFMWLRDRWALYPKINSTKPIVWYHGSSLGEVLALIPLMKKFKEKYDHTQVLSVNTVRGEHIAIEKKVGDHLIFFPFDTFHITKRSLKKISPHFIVILETEIWPDFFWQATRRKIPIIMVSGRISEKSFPKYYLARSFFKTVLQEIHCLMRSQQDAERIIKIGAFQKKVSVFGDIKYDGLEIKITNDDKKKLNVFPKEQRIIVAGSTHAGEEKIICSVFKELQKRFENICLIIVPRHLERLKEVEKIVKTSGLNYCLRSQLPKTCEVIIADTYGELRMMYWIAEIVFVGGSLVPIGGHNIMEAASFAKPVISGKYTSNFRRHIQSLKQYNGICIIQNENQLEKALTTLMMDTKKAKEMGIKGQKVVLENQGALEKCIDFLQRFI